MTLDLILLSEKEMQCTNVGLDRLYTAIERSANIDTSAGRKRVNKPHLYEANQFDHLIKSLPAMASISKTYDRF